MHLNVAVDTNGNGLWKYDTESKRYFRMQEDGTISAVINGEFLPDPELQWDKRLQMYGVNRESDMADKLRPQPATYALWNHWQGMQHADANH